MPRVELDTVETTRWEEALTKTAENEVARTGLHVSDLILCLRQGEIQREYLPDWNITTLYQFTMGRAFEKAVFQLIKPELMHTEELEVEQDGIVGHIDFGADPYDYECKATWSNPGDDAHGFFSDKFWWLEQAGMYAIMRRRRAVKFAVLYIPPWPQPQLYNYHVEWTAEEQGELWKMVLARKKYVLGKRAKGELPNMTTMKWLCTNCSVKEICPKL